MTVRTADDLLEDYGVPEEILSALDSEQTQEVLTFVERAVERDRHALTTWMVTMGYLADFVLSKSEREEIVRKFYTLYDDTYTSEEEFVQAYASNYWGVQGDALDYLNVDKAYHDLVERSEDNKFIRLDLAGNGTGFAVFWKSPSSN